MAATKYSSSLAERVPSKVVRRQLAFLSLHPWAHFFPSACRPAADQGMAHAAFGRVMCHMNPINTQPGPVGCWNDFGIQNVQDPPPQNSTLAGHVRLSFRYDVLLLLHCYSTVKAERLLIVQLVRFDL